MVFKKIMLWLLALIIILGLVFALGPKEPVDETITFDPVIIGNDIESYLKTTEASVADIKPGAEKQIIWHDAANKQKQPYAIIYLHGFSASLQEIRPVPDMVAKALKANIYYARLKGHGRQSISAMGEASVNDWFNDAAEALEIGKRIGEKVIIISTSTGGTLATWMAEHAAFKKDIAAMVMVSPNYGVQAAGAEALTLPWARQLVPLAFGETREWEPKNEQQRQWWSTKYQNIALLPMMALVQRANGVAFEELTTPTLFIFHPEDGVVQSAITEKLAKRWGKNTGTKVSVHKVTNSTDTHNHVIAGDILSPQNTKPVADKIIEWINAL